MTVSFRIMLVAVSVLTLIYILRKVRQSKVQIEYTLFWIIFSAILVVISVFPKIVEILAELLSIYSPTNCVFLIMIFILFLRSFQTTIENSKLDDKVRKLTQIIALQQNKENADEEAKNNEEI